MKKQKEFDRYDELYQEALGHMLNKMDFDPTEWLEEEEAQELAHLSESLFD